MTDNRELERVHDKLDRLVVDVGKLSAIPDTLTRLDKMLLNHEGRLGKMEVFNYERLDERLDALEGWKGTVKGWLAGAGAVVTVAGGVTFWYIQHLLSKLG